MSLARLRKELMDIEVDKDTSGVYARVRGDDMTKLVGTLKGPEDTPYAGGVFVVDIQIPQQVRHFLPTDLLPVAPPLAQLGPCVPFYYIFYFLAHFPITHITFPPLFFFSVLFTFVSAVFDPKQYPFEPPKMKFETRMWHPNVSSQTGAICLDILKDKWSPALTIKTALVSLQALLSAPEPDDPQDAEVANMFKSDKPKYERTAAEWTATYATKQDDTQKMSYLTGMGFPEQQCRAALQASGGDQQQALEALLSG